MKLKQCIALEQAQDGQMLATDVSDIHDNCLVSAGVVLSNHIISSLQQRGIEFLVVWSQELSEDEIAEYQTDIKQRLAHRFRKHQENSEMRLLHDILLDWRLNRHES